jgi:hypothetical protein
MLRLKTPQYSSWTFFIVQVSPAFPRDGQHFVLERELYVLLLHAREPYLQVLSRSSCQGS